MATRTCRRCLFDGTTEVEGVYGNLSNQYAQYEAAYLAQAAVPTDVTLDLAASPIGYEETYRVGVRVCVEAGGTAKTMRINVVQLLDYWPVVPDWPRHAYKNTVGVQDVTLQPGECTVLTFDFDFDLLSWGRQEDVRMVAWAQDPEESGPPGDRALVHQAAIIEWPLPPDCNMNGVPDEKDILEGTSADVNGNLVPDECESPVFAGSDLYVTPGLAGGPTLTSQDLSEQPLPADFFGPGSDPFDGIIYYVGNPLNGTGLPPDTDTIVERLADAELPSVYGTEDTVDTQIVALSLVSSMPITVAFNGGAESAVYDVQVCLSSVASQPVGQTTIRHLCPEGGTYDLNLPVVPKLVFAKIAGVVGEDVVELDPAPQLDYAVLNGNWSNNDPGFGIYAAPAGGLVDHDCDAVADVAYPPTTNFFPGVYWIECDTGTAA